MASSSNPFAPWWLLDRVSYGRAPEDDAEKYVRGGLLDGAPVPQRINGGLLDGAYVMPKGAPPARYPLESAVPVPGWVQLDSASPIDARPAAFSDLISATMGEQRYSPEANPLRGTLLDPALIEAQLPPVREKEVPPRPALPDVDPVEPDPRDRPDSEVPRSPLEMPDKPSWWPPHVPWSPLPEEDVLRSWGERKRELEGDLQNFEDQEMARRRAASDPLYRQFDEEMDAQVRRGELDGAEAQRWKRAFRGRARPVLGPDYAADGNAWELRNLEQVLRDKRLDQQLPRDEQKRALPKSR
jgi:hypothetical protein